MKCSKCGAELREGVLFCRECGTKVEEVKMKKRFCRECGSEYAEGSKFCTNCGANLTLFNTDGQDTDNTKDNFWEDIAKDEPNDTIFSLDGPGQNQTAKSDNNTGQNSEWTSDSGFLDDFFSTDPNAEAGKVSQDSHEESHENPYKDTANNIVKEKGKGADLWNNSDLFIKIAVIIAAVGILLFIAALFQHKYTAIILSIMQIGGAAAAGLIHLGFVKNLDSKTKYAVLALAVLFALMNIASVFNTRSSNPAYVQDEIKVPENASSYKYDDYQDVQNSLSQAGFTNIDTEIQYDIVFGLTKEGEVESVSIDGNSEFKKGDLFKKDAQVIITYHMKEEDDPDKASEEAEPSEKEADEEPLPIEEEGSEETVPVEEEAVEESEPAEKDVTEEPETEEKEAEEEAEEESSEKDEEQKGEPVDYSTNTMDTVRDGNAGIYSYKSRGGSYAIYYIIDFDEGYVYRFTEGNGDSTCDRLKIDKGDLNTVVIVTYHDGGDTWQNGLHFKHAKMPDHLILEDNDHMEYDFYTTDLDDALQLRDQKTIHDY